MKTNLKLVGIITFLVCAPLYLLAQENAPRPLFREVLSPEKVARRETDEMKRELQLTDKQYDKIYKLNLKEQKKRFSALQTSGRQHPLTGSGHPSGRGSEHGHSGMGEGRPPMMGGSEPSMMKERPTNMPEMRETLKKGDEKEIQKSIIAREKKIKKILTSEQYEKWQKKESAHKDEHHGKGLGV